MFGETRAREHNGRYIDIRDTTVRGHVAIFGKHNYGDTQVRGHIEIYPVQQQTTTSLIIKLSSSALFKILLKEPTTRASKLVCKYA